MNIKLIAYKLGIIFLFLILLNDRLLALQLNKNLTVMGTSLSNVKFEDYKGYSHENYTKNNNEDWMKYLNGETKINKISLPGTHNSLSFYGGDIVQTQSLSLENQLKAGIRVFDIRCKAESNFFYIYHGFIYQFDNLDNVFSTMTNFLKKHPSELLLVSIKQEHSRVSNSEFTKIYYDYKEKYKEKIWTPTSFKASIPKLKEVRGKIIIINRWKPTGVMNRVGLDWNYYFNVLDDYHLNTNWDLYKKWQKIKDKFTSIHIQENKFDLTFLSGSGGSFPYFVASGHSSPQTYAPALLTGLTTPIWESYYPDFARVSCLGRLCSIVFNGTNVLTYYFILKNQLSYIGIIMADFPADALINIIISLNKQENF